MSSPPAESVSIPAATVVPLRDGPSGLEVLMLHRNSSLAFGGLWVFPGGRVDPSDGSSADGELAVARRAAVREAVEEAGLILDESTLVAFSHWTPPPQAPRRFLTWFFVAEVVGEVDITIDGGEIHDHVWTTPQEMMRRRDAGEVELAPPTWMTLHRVAASPDVVSAIAEAVARAPQMFATRVATGDEGPVMLWEGDAGWSSGDANMPGARHRLVTGPSGWRYEGR